MTRPVTIVAAAAAVGLVAVATPHASAASGNLLRNPGFEKSLTSNVWKGEDCCVTTSDPHSGAWIAWMGGNGTRHTDKISQRVSIPRADGAQLSFWIKITTEEPAGDPTDTFKVRVSSNGTTRTVKSLSSADATATYVKYSVGMNRYTGKTVTVAFVATENQGNRTDFQLDDTALRTT